MSTARRRRVPRRLLGTGLATLLTTTGALAVTGQPASALLNFVQPVQTTWTDNAQPTRSFPAEDRSVPVGTGPDGTATITLTPTEGGGNFLFVSSRTASGITSGEDYYYFYVTYPS
ncbi:hypothetical protein [Micromonospora sp. NPDC005299]|uniref:hypothetical protein n=1 Tax=Micromonospora sp. NPDC005299 TaxID=3364231 RepID=UPI0036C12E29